MWQVSEYVCLTERDLVPVHVLESHLELLVDSCGGNLLQLLL